MTLKDPRFVGPARGKLDSQEAITLVADALGDQLPVIVAVRPDLNAALRTLDAVASDGS
ncbi:MAG: hypothetical protein JWM89_899 [Acidimicrobiales bacterium]|nr:hypothetical protein [Acidimicrobiales bacterium]